MVLLANSGDLEEDNRSNPGSLVVVILGYIPGSKAMPWRLGVRRDGF
jgi:hypothetical protein